MDHHLEHVTPTRLAELNGALDLDQEEARLGVDAVEDALARVRASLDARVRRGTLDKSAFPFALLEQRRFPAYSYSTIDEAWACRRLLRGCKHKPLGLTCCVDEAAIFVALNLVAHDGALDEFAILASPAHYTVLAWRGAETFWFYSKHEMHSEDSWRRLVGGDAYGGDAQRAFDDRLGDFDRVITESGSYALASGRSSIDGTRLQELLARIEALVGCRLTQLARAAAPVAEPSPTGAPPLLQRLAAAPDAHGVLRLLRSAALDSGHPTALRALYAFRVLDVPDPRPYLVAARRGARVAESARALATVDDALRLVAAIPGDSSIFEDAGRIALPDETLRFATGTHRDKALLLHVVLERVLDAREPARAGIATLLTADDSFVCGSGLCLGTARMARVAAVEGAVLYRIADV
jgi:hypothetical protein